MDADLKNDIAAAFEAADKQPEPSQPSAPDISDRPEETPQAPSGLETSSPAIGDRARDEKGRFAPKVGDPSQPREKTVLKPEEPKPVEATPDTAQTPPVQPTPEPEAPKLKAPASWKPTFRESWDKVPPDLQQEIHRREREMAAAFRDTTEARQTYNKLKEVITPYEHLFRSEGVEPIQGINNLIRTTAALATGPQQTKAQIVAGIIKSYGVDIATLDALLSGQAAPQTAPQEPPRDPRLDALLAQAAQIKAQREQQMQQKAQEQIAEIEGEEFFSDVREDMADILEVARRRGLPMSIRDAYNRAVALHPEVSRVIEQRKAASASANVQRSMAASSSVRPQPAAAVPVPSGSSLRDDLEQAVKVLNSRS